MRTEIAALLCMLACGGASAQTARPTLDDPRPNGRLSVREMSLCEPPQAPVPRPDWCDYPHEVRAFTVSRDACDQLRGEPWPNGDGSDDRQRRLQLTQGMRLSCAGTDKRLAQLVRRYAAEPQVMAVLSGYARDIEATLP